ncbi:MAG TPA: hypothetical protein ENF64_02755, partial [Hadesarchaea archaeon]|nr:hypothetical protein [Hadesarchaea archaeon]
SYDELENFVKTGLTTYEEYNFYDMPLGSMLLAQPARLEIAKSYFGFTVDGGDGFEVTINGPDFSTTNIQVEGVDEADIVKSDGKYLYVVSGNEVIIIDAYPPEAARVVSIIPENKTPCELYINGNRLVVLGQDFVKVYDVADKEHPVLRRKVSFDGYYFNSRMIGPYVYLIITSPPIYALSDRINLPEFSCNGETRTVDATEIYYFENMCDRSYQFTTIMAVNTQNDDEEITSETFLMSAAQNLFVSSTNIYITYTNYSACPGNWSNWYDSEKTIIHKIRISGGEIVYVSKGEVPGHVLNQFSMDEYQGYFRVATTTGWYGANHIYVLDEDLNVIGRLENLAPGERIYSARFMGNRAYLVTFVKVDPLFVIDLSNPANPKVLGELKIPGYSDYLHPYDETHLIGIGKDTTADSGWALYQGVKIALFDVSDPENPVEISKYVIGRRGTESYALQDHRAFLFSRSRNLLAIPVGDYYTQAAYVFHISPEKGLILRGTITHGKHSVKRTLYVDDVIYTVSDKLVKMNDLESLNEIGTITLSSPHVVEITGRRTGLEFGRHDLWSTEGGLSSMIGLPSPWGLPVDFIAAGITVST